MYVVPSAIIPLADIYSSKHFGILKEIWVFSLSCFKKKNLKNSWGNYQLQYFVSDDFGSVGINFYYVFAIHKWKKKSEQCCWSRTGLQQSAPSSVLPSTPMGSAAWLSDIMDFWEIIHAQKLLSCWEQTSSLLNYLHYLSFLCTMSQSKKQWTVGWSVEIKLLFILKLFIIFIYYYLFIIILFYLF